MEIPNHQWFAMRKFPKNRKSAKKNAIFFARTPPVFLPKRVILEVFLRSGISRASQVVIHQQFAGIEKRAIFRKSWPKSVESGQNHVF